MADGDFPIPIPMEDLTFLGVLSFDSIMVFLKVLAAP
jgi:hypothetical protein